MYTAPCGDGFNGGNLSNDLKVHDVSASSSSGLQMHDTYAAVLFLMVNEGSRTARPELLLEAGARHERTLEAVSSRPLLGGWSGSHCACGTTPRTANAFARSENAPSGLLA